MECLWCGKISENNPFCIGGGQTIGPSKTEKGTFTKSYCMDSFVTIYNATEKSGLPFSENEKQFFLHKDAIKDWYKSIPTIIEKDTPKEGENQGGL